MEKVLSNIFAFIFLIIVISGSYFIYRYSLKVKAENLERDRQREKERIQHYTRIKDNYFNSLKKLKNDPTNADVKIYTLEAGRKYAELTRQYVGHNGITLYDEVALMNDINAACASAAITSSKNSASDLTVEERLAKLSELKEKNLISETEHNERRQKILDEI